MPPSCLYCGLPLSGQNRITVRRYCSPAHRWKDRDRRASADFVAWWESGQQLQQEQAAGLQKQLLRLAPLGASTYRLTCPTSKGKSLTFPKVLGWRLRPFEAPYVPWPGLYLATFEGTKPGIIGEGLIQICLAQYAPVSAGEKSVIKYRGGT